MIYVDFTRYFCKWPTFWPTFIIFSVYKNNHAAYKPRGYHILYGGDKEDRTPDLLHAMQALSQLSYTPEALEIITYSSNKSKGTYTIFMYFPNPVDDEKNAPQ